MVRVAGFEPTASWSRTKRATNCATPRYDPLHLWGCLIYYTDSLEKVKTPQKQMCRQSIQIMVE